MKLNGPCGCCAGCSIPADAVHGEDWDDQPCGLNVPLLRWESVSGATDTVGAGCQYVIVEDWGRFIDIAGSPSKAHIRTATDWTAGAGDHELVIFLAGENRVGASATIEVSYGPITAQITKASADPFTSHRWTIPGGTSGRLSLRSVDADVYGVLVNCVYLRPVPAP